MAKEQHRVSLNAAAMTLQDLIKVLNDAEIHHSPREEISETALPALARPRSVPQLREGWNQPRPTKLVNQPSSDAMEPFHLPTPSANSRPSTSQAGLSSKKQMRSRGQLDAIPQKPMPRVSEEEASRMHPGVTDVAQHDACEEDNRRPRTRLDYVLAQHEEEEARRPKTKLKHDETSPVQKDTISKKQEMQEMRRRAEAKSDSLEMEIEKLKRKHLDELNQLRQELSTKEGELGRLKKKLRTKEEELKETVHDLELKHEALEKVMQEQIESLKAKHMEDLSHLRSELSCKDEELARLRSEIAHGKTKPTDDLNLTRTKLQEIESARDKLQRDYNELQFTRERLETKLEQEIFDCESFVKQIAKSSSRDVMDSKFETAAMDILGMGNYGYVLTAESKAKGKRVVLKLQSSRWAAVAIREWAHGSSAGKHPNIVEYTEAVLHKDEDGSIKSLLQSAFDDGRLKGKRPKQFPESWFVLSLEFMDRGTVQSLMDRNLLNLDGVGAVTRQIASALAFMHSNKSTHNDIKTENILLCTSGSGELEAKLADLGLACHSKDRGRDFELFAYTVECMALHEKFTKVPAQDERDAVVTRMRQQRPDNKSKVKLWNAVTDVVSGCYKRGMEMIEVSQHPCLQDLTVKIPEDRSSHAFLEQAARRATIRRASISNHSFAMRATRSNVFPEPTDSLQDHDSD